MKGYDHAFLLQAKGDGKKVAAHVWSADEKLQLKVYTTAPALQFYSGNFLGGTPSRGTEPYADWQGLALESEFLRTARTTLNGRNRTASCVLAKSIQPDGISVYCSVMLRPRQRGLYLILFKSPANTDIFATQYSQQPYTAPLFSLSGYA